ncbi:hypothetical protein bmyco0002_10750 [Bacillus pseudomycoides]|nr:hypothetical protein bmyco0002_10750 [Bacillus pseudomycoides]
MLMRYIKLEIAYKFKPEGNTYEQTHYLPSSEEDIDSVKQKLLSVYSNIFNSIAIPLRLTVSEVTELEYQGGQAEEKANLRLLESEYGEL